MCRRDNVQPEDLGELAAVDEVSLVADSSCAEPLYVLKQPGHPVPDWDAVEGTTSEALLRAVWQQQIDCTVADSHIVAISQRDAPALSGPMHLSREQRLAWAMPSPWIAPPCAGSSAFPVTATGSARRRASTTCRSCCSPRGAIRNRTGTPARAARPVCAAS